VYEDQRAIGVCVWAALTNRNRDRSLCHTAAESVARPRLAEGLLLRPDFGGSTGPAMEEKGDI